MKTERRKMKHGKQNETGWNITARVELVREMVQTFTYIYLVDAFIYHLQNQWAESKSGIYQSSSWLRFLFKGPIVALEQ